jgi:hypothetical protein
MFCFAQTNPIKGPMINTESISKKWTGVYGKHFSGFDGDLSLLLVYGRSASCRVLRPEDEKGPARGFSTRRLCADIFSAKAMTPIEISFRYGRLPGEREIRALDRMHAVCGIRRIGFNESQHTIGVEYDAARLCGDDVAALLRDAGIDAVWQKSI